MSNGVPRPVQPSTSVSPVTIHSGVVMEIDYSSVLIDETYLVDGVWVQFGDEAAGDLWTGPLLCVASYTPQVGDLCQVLVAGRDRFILGRMNKAIGRVNVYRCNAEQSLSLAGSYQLLDQWDSMAIEYQSGPINSSGGVYTFTEPGVYEIRCAGYLAKSVAASEIEGALALYKNGAFTGGSFLQVAPFLIPAFGSTTWIYIVVHSTEVFAVNDTIRAGIDISTVSAGGSVTFGVNGALYSSEFSIVRIE